MPLRLKAVSSVRQQDADVDPGMVSKDDAAGPSSPTHAPRPRSLKIIYADDNIQLGDVVTQLFKHVGHTAEHAADGLAAWERISADLEHFDVVITDNAMPKLNGVQLVGMLREANYGGRIIVHSSALRESEMQSYRRLRVDRIVPKDAHPFSIVHAVRDLFQD